MRTEKPSKHETDEEELGHMVQSSKEILIRLKRKRFSGATAIRNHAKFIRSTASAMRARETFFRILTEEKLKSTPK